MDLRTERTKRCIANAFIQLRSKKPLEKITVKELSDLAMVHKATFYNHYQDIYDLSEQLENETIETILNNVSHLDSLIYSPKEVTKDFIVAINSQSELFNILFSNSRQGILVQKLDYYIKERLYKKFPKYKENLEFDVALSLFIQGSFYTVLHYSEKDFSKVIDILGNMSETLMAKFR